MPAFAPAGAHPNPVPYHASYPLLQTEVRFLMTYDLVIRRGTIVDGSGAPRFRADLAVQDGRIASIGRISDAGREEIDADGLVVAPGFIDGHTHFDAQISWDPYGTSSDRKRVV